MARKYKVGFKTINEKLQVTKRHLNKIKKHVKAGDRKKIEAQVQAIGVIIAACKTARMSVTYTADSD